MTSTRSNVLFVLTGILSAATIGVLAEDALHQTYAPTIFGNALLISTAASWVVWFLSLLLDAIRTTARQIRTEVVLTGLPGRARPLRQIK